MYELKNIHGGYRQGVLVLKGVNLTIMQGETLAVLGQNGSGKSTLAKAMLGMLPFVQGEVIFNKIPVNQYATLARIKSGMGFFMQGGRVFPHLTLTENLRFAAHNLSNKQFAQRVGQLRQNFTLLQSEKLTMEASYLSGGEKHSLALAMVMINSPKLLILDEPSAGLSPANVQLMYQTIANLKQAENMTVLLIEQNVEKAIQYSNRVALLSNGIIAKVLDVNSVHTLEQINEFYFSLEN